MKTLLLMRHAKSSWKYPDLPDHDRPLKKRGLHDARTMGEHLLERKRVPQLIASSTAVRAEQTARLVAEVTECPTPIDLAPTFYQAGPSAYVAYLRALDDTVMRVLLIGHNPGLEVLLEALTGQPERLPTAAIAEIALQIDAWQDLQETPCGELIAISLPGESD